MLTGLEIIEWRILGWRIGYRYADTWRDQHRDADVMPSMPDFSWGIDSPEDLPQVRDLDQIAQRIDFDDEHTRSVFDKLQKEIIETISEAASQAWDVYREQCCDQDNQLINSDQ